jgi:chorismate mutase
MEGDCMARGPTLILVDVSVLPDVFAKVIEVKKILSSGAAKTVNEAAAQVGVSRSAYYKYKDYVFPFYESSRGKIITLNLVLEDFSGILARIIKSIAKAKGNIVTINQNIPINGLADVTISIETNEMVKDIKDLMDEIKKIEGVRRQVILARD